MVTDPLSSPWGPSYVNSVGLSARAHARHLQIGASDHTRINTYCRLRIQGGPSQAPEEMPPSSLSLNQKGGRIALFCDP